MLRFYYIEAFYPDDDPDLLYFRHRIVTAEDEFQAVTSAWTNIRLVRASAALTPT